MRKISYVRPPTSRSERASKELAAGMDLNLRQALREPVEPPDGDDEPRKRPGEQDREVGPVDAQAARAGQDRVPEAVGQVLQRERGRERLEPGRQLRGREEDAGDEEERQGDEGDDRLCRRARADR